MKTNITKLNSRHVNYLFNTLASPLAALLALFAIHSYLFTASAAVPLEWTVHPRNPAPAAFDRHHGETLDFRCTFAGFGAPWVTPR